MCSIGFIGAGYDDAFIANMSHIVRGQLRAVGGRDITVRISTRADSICAPCPSRIGQGCEHQAQVDALDGRHAAHLGLTDGDLLTWGDCLDRVRDRTLPDDLDTLCAGCGWLEMGACKAAVGRLAES